MTNPSITTTLNLKDVLTNPSTTLLFGLVDVPPTPQYLSINDIAIQLLANAAANHAPSQSVLTQIAINKFANNEFLAELDTNAVAYA